MDAATMRTAMPVASLRRREYGLDWLRVFAFVILIGYHTGMYFVPWPWSVKNPAISDWLTWPMMFINRWRLPLLFFISGAGVWLNLRSRGYGAFVSERLRRRTSRRVTARAAARSESRRVASARR